MILNTLIDELFNVAYCPLRLILKNGTESIKRVPKGCYDLIFDNPKIKDSFIEKLSSIDKPILFAGKNSIAGIKFPDESLLILGPLSFDDKKLFAFQVKAVNAMINSLFFTSRLLLEQNLPCDKKEIEEILKENTSFKVPSLQEVLPTEVPHNSYSWEVMYLDAITNGDSQMVVRLKNAPQHGKVGRLAYTSLRNAQNHAIISATLAARAAIRGGLNVETAYTVADFYILAAEKAKSEEEANKINLQSAVSFAKLVKEINENEKKSLRPLSIQLLTEIERNIYTSVTCEQLAQTVGKSVDHLERIIKEDTGHSILENLTLSRMKVAKDLLANSNTSIGDISDLLTFSSSSHFARVFKQYCKLRPNEYRKINYKLVRID